VIQDIDAVSLVQRYTLGMRYALDDRVFRYAKAGSTLDTDVGALNALFQAVGYSQVNAALQGAKTVVITLDGHAAPNGDGQLGDNVIAEDELAGGYMLVYTHEFYHPPYSWTINRKILKNTATDGAHLVMTVTIDRPLPVALTGANTMHAECIPSPYGKVVSGKPPAWPLMARMSVVGFPTLSAQVDEYLWLQTWGPVYAACGPGDHFGDSDVNRNLVFNSYGAVDYPAAYPNGQHAGHVLSNFRLGTPGTAIFFLEITP